MAHSIEILLDPDLDAAIRREWSVLESAGLPNAGRVRSKTNRPHCTLAAGTAIDPAADTALDAVAMRLPVELRLGSAAVFGSGNRFTLVRSVIASTELLSIHAACLRLAGNAVTNLVGHCMPGQWTPHVTLARRMTAEHVAAALVALSWETVVGRAVDLRRWDGDAGTEHTIVGRDC